MNEKCPECGTELVEQIEEREGRNKEIVRYCNGCGYTDTQKN